MTNADCIRAMTDEEIENWYWWMHEHMMCYTDSRGFVHAWLKDDKVFVSDEQLGRIIATELA